MGDGAQLLAQLQEHVGRAQQEVAEGLGRLVSHQIPKGCVIDRQRLVHVIAVVAHHLDDVAAGLRQIHLLLRRQRAHGLDLVDLAQHAHHVGPELGHGPFVVEKSAPAEHAFAEIIAGEIQRQAQRLQLFVHLARQHRRHQPVAGAAAAAARHGHQLGHLAGDEFVHPLLVAFGNGEIAGRHVNLVVAQMFAQQERVQGRHRVQQPQNHLVALQAFGIVVAGLAQAVRIAALVHEQRTPAGPQVGRIERDQDLGRHGARACKQIGFVGAGSVLQQERLVDDGRQEQRLFGMFGIARIILGDAEQVQHAAGGGAAQGAHETDGTIGCHGQYPAGTAPW